MYIQKVALHIIKYWQRSVEYGRIFDLMHCMAVCKHVQYCNHLEHLLHALHGLLEEVQLLLLGVILLMAVRLALLLLQQLHLVAVSIQLPPQAVILLL